jgi:hypothetical protein
LYDIVSNQAISEKERKKIDGENSYAPTIEGDTEYFCSIYSLQFISSIFVPPEFILNNVSISIVADHIK